MATDDSEPTMDASGKPAKHRLRDMLTTAVGLVDHAANEEVFLVVKSKDGNSMANAEAEKTDDENEGGLRLPAAAKQSITDALADTLEKLAAIAQQVQGSVVDEGAECPPELAAQIDEIADDLDELADEFMPKATPAEMKAKSVARKANAIAKAKAKAFPGAAPPFGGVGSKDKDEASDTAKGSGSPIGGPPAQGAGKDVPRDPPGEGPGANGSPAARGTATNPDVVMKSGRKIAQARLAALSKGHGLHSEAMGYLEKAVACLKSGHGEIGNVLKEVGDPTFMQPPGAAPKEQPPVKKPPPAEPEVSPKGNMPDVTGMAKAAAEDAAQAAAKAAVETALAEPMAQLSKAMTDLSAMKKSIGDTAALETLRGLTGKPRSQPNDGPPPTAAKPKQAWPPDMSADIKARRATK